jgi:hypothetical protein
MTEIKRPPNAPTLEGPRPKPLTTGEILALVAASAFSAPPSKKNAAFQVTRKKWAEQLAPEPRETFERLLDEADDRIAEGWAIRRAAYAYAEQHGARRGRRRESGEAALVRRTLDWAAAGGSLAANTPEQPDEGEP